MFVVFEKNGAIFLVSLCPIAKSSTTKSRFARLDKDSKGERGRKQWEREKVRGVEREREWGWEREKKREGGSVSENVHMYVPHAQNCKITYRFYIRGFLGTYSFCTFVPPGIQHFSSSDLPCTFAPFPHAANAYYVIGCDPNLPRIAYPTMLL